MGNIDHKLVLADAYTPRAVATAIQTNPATTAHFMIDTGAAAGERGRYSDPLRFVVMLQEKAVGAAATTLDVELFATDDPAGTAVQEQVFVRKFTIGTAGLMPQKLIDVPMPRFSKRYLKVRWTVLGASMTGGKVTAFLSEGGETQHAAPTAWPVRGGYSKKDR